MPKINDDLLKERAKCTFNVEELTTFMDGGPQKTKERRDSGKSRVNKLNVELVVYLAL